MKHNLPPRALAEETFSARGDGLWEGRARDRLGSPVSVGHTEKRRSCKGKNKYNGRRGKKERIGSEQFQVGGWVSMVIRGRSPCRQAGPYGGTFLIHMMRFVFLEER